ncbi:hypothetical protein Tco_0453058 [Tanacetum coccineum]
MSSDNASSAVTYTSISSDSNGPSWGIPLVNVGELLEMDPYEEVAQQGQAPPLSPAYVLDPMELDEHVPVYVLEPEHLEYHVPSDDDIQVEDQPYADDASPTAESPGHIADSESIEEDSIDYPDEPEDDDEDPKEDPKEDHTDYPADDEDKEPTEDEEEGGQPSSRRPFRAWKTVRLEPPMSGSKEAHIAEHEIYTYCSPMVDVAESSAAAARPPRGQYYDFVDTVEAGQGSEHRMDDFHEEVTLRVSTRHKFAGMRVRARGTAYETELHEVRQAYLSSEARNRALLARLETLETHMSRMEWQRQRAEDDAVRQMMRTHVLEARAQIDTVEDTGSSC